MQDVVATEPLRTEAKLTARDEVARNAPTVDAQGALDVRGAQDVYLNLQSSEVASLTRQGADLVLVDANGQVLRLEGFFDGAEPRKLFLEGDNDSLMQLETAGALSDGPVAVAAVPQAGLSPFISLTEAGSSGVVGAAPLGLGQLLGLGGGGAAAAAAAGGGGGGGGNGGGGDNPPPPADTTPPAAAAGLRFNAAGTTVSGTGEPGATVTIRNAAGAVVGTGTVQADGSFTVTLQTPLTNGEGVNVTLTDAAGNTSPVTTVTAPDSTAPTAPTNIVVDGGSASGSGEPGATVTVKGPDGAVLGTGTVNPDGTFSIPLSPAPTNGETL
uniref:Ig-like domain-containing protein n=1 Tax=Brevundimonas sp. TaxID=1871086 RepID=UPI0037BFDBDA